MWWTYSWRWESPEESSWCQRHSSRRCPSPLSEGFSSSARVRSKDFNCQTPWILWKKREKNPHTVLVSRTWYIPNSIRSTRPPRKMYMNILQRDRHDLNQPHCSRLSWCPPGKRHPQPRMLPPRTQLMKRKAACGLQVFNLPVMMKGEEQHLFCLTGEEPEEQPDSSLFPFHTSLYRLLHVPKSSGEARITPRTACSLLTISYI